VIVRLVMLLKESAKGELSIYLSSPLFQMIEALKQAGDTAIELIGSLTMDVAGMVWQLLQNAVHAHGSKDASLVDDAVWLAEKLTAAQATYTGQRVSLTSVDHMLNSAMDARTEIQRVKNSLPAKPAGKTSNEEARPSLDDQVRTPLREPAGGPAQFTVPDGASAEVMTQLAEEYLTTHGGDDHKSTAQALSQLMAGLIPLLAVQGTRDDAIEVLISLEPSIDFVINNLRTELASTLDAQGLCNLVGSLEAKIATGSGAILIELAAMVVTTSAWKHNLGMLTEAQSVTLQRVFSDLSTRTGKQLYLLAKNAVANAKPK